MSLFVGAAQAQLSRGGQPLDWQLGVPVETGLPVFLSGGVEHMGDLPEAGFRLGEPRLLTVDVPVQGQWNLMPDGGASIRLVLASPGATMMNVRFDRWDLPPGAMVYLYDADRTRFIGGFNQANRGPDGTMATALIPGDQVVLEYHVPPGAHPGALRVNGIGHGTVDLFRRGGTDRDFNPGFQSSPCHINMACPEAASWQTEKRAVVMFFRPDMGGCTGTLINNTAVPGRPLVYLAQHCSTINFHQWVFYFNYEAPACIGNAGSTDHTLVGGVKRSDNGAADFVIVELFDQPPPAFMPYYAGWDRTGATPQSGTVIHHPLYDVKKITFNYGPVTEYVDAWGTPMWRNYWDLGIVEAVSSGATMLDQHRRIVGHMTEGAQDCTNAATVHTGCAKFELGWDGPSPGQRKWDWLDPSNSVQVLDGYDQYAVSPEVKVHLRAYLDGPYESGPDLMRDDLRAQGLVPLNEPYAGIGYMHVGGGGGESVAASVLNVMGANAIVDWVVMEVRSAAQPGTVLASRAALIQRDGDVVDLDGTSAVSLPLAPGSYHVALRHRNHLGVMTAAPVALSAVATPLDLRSGAVALYGGAGAQKVVGTRRTLWSGDTNFDNGVKYTGSGNDRDPILTRIGGTIPSATASGYYREDVNLDGQVKYTGGANDRDLILQNVGGTVPTAVLPGSLP